MMARRTVALMHTTPIIAGVGLMLGLLGCAHRQSDAQADPVKAIQRNLLTPNGCGSNEVTYCAAHGSKGKEGLCQCVKQQDAQSALENL
jgi:hypothetical protein